MCDFAERYLKTNMRVSLIQTSLTTISTVVMPPNPLRYMIILPYSGTNQLSFQFGDLLSGVGVNGYVGNPPQSHLSRDDLGDIITYPVRMWVQSATANLRFEEISFDPNHFLFYRRLMDEWFANAST